MLSNCMNHRMKHNDVLPSMKTLRIALATLLVSAGSFTASAQLETTFTYQGRLVNTNGPLDGHYNFIFSLYDNAGNQVGDSVTNLAVMVAEGNFGVTLDFGPNSFRRTFVPPRDWIGPGEWLEISVRTNRAKTYQTLSPRQRLTPAPYASTVTGTLPSSAIEGIYSGKVNFGNSSNVFLGKYYGDGANLTNVGGGTLWQTAGNAGTVPGTHFLGTTDGQALELRVNGQRAFRLEPKTASPNIVGGFAGNFVGAGYDGAVVAGGGANTDTNRVKGSYGTVSGGSGNAVDSSWSAVGGGRGNTVQAASGYANIGGGSANSIASDGGYSVIGGGQANIVSGEKSAVGGGTFHQITGDYSFIGGGDHNSARNRGTVAGGARNKSDGNYASVGGGYTNTAYGDYSVVAGGSLNRALAQNATVGGGNRNTADGTYDTVSGGRENMASGNYSTVGGGNNNLASGVYSAVGGGSENEVTKDYSTVGGGSGNRARGLYATVPGGRDNDAFGQYSFAAGRRAHAWGAGSFVWADNTDADFTAWEAETNMFRVRATGGAKFFTGANGFWTEGDMSCATLTIRGGADLAEPFAMSDDLVQPGAVVVIDPDQPGRLKLSTSAYDHKVAGIVSGAGGVQPGISMIQTEKLESGKNVALSGRVFALVDATKQPVRPGDLLTTSDTPGHAMKAVNPALAQGAILGKAMTPLSGERGLVLVLVSLQ